MPASLLPADCQRPDPLFPIRSVVDSIVWLKGGALRSGFHDEHVKGLLVMLVQQAQRDAATAGRTSRGSSSSAEPAGSGISPASLWEISHFLHNTNNALLDFLPLPLSTQLLHLLIDSTAKELWPAQGHGQALSDWQRKLFKVDHRDAACAAEAIAAAAGQHHPIATMLATRVALASPAKVCQLDPRRLLSLADILCAATDPEALSVMLGPSWRLLQTQPPAGPPPEEGDDAAAMKGPTPPSKPLASWTAPVSFIFKAVAASVSSPTSSVTSPDLLTEAIHAAVWAQERTTEPDAVRLWDLVEQAYARGGFMTGQAHVRVVGSEDAAGLSHQYILCTCCCLPLTQGTAPILPPPWPACAALSILAAVLRLGRSGWPSSPSWPATSSSTASTTGAWPSKCRPRHRRSGASVPPQGVQGASLLWSRGGSWPACSPSAPWSLA